MEQLRITMWLDKSSVIRNILINGFCKLLFNNHKVFKFLEILEEECYVSLLILWRSNLLTNQDKNDLASKQILTVFFTRMTNLSEKTYFKIYHSHLIFF